VFGCAALSGPELGRACACAHVPPVYVAASRQLPTGDWGRRRRAAQRVDQVRGRIASSRNWLCGSNGFVLRARAPI